MDAWWKSLVAWVSFPGCLVRVPGCLDSLPGSLNMVAWIPGEGFWLLGFGSWFPGLGSMILSKFLAAWIHFLVLWTWLNRSQMKVFYYLDYLPGCVNLVPWFPSEGFWLPGFGSWFNGHGCMVTVPGCLDSLPGSLDLVPLFPGEGYWLPQFGSCFPELGSMNAFWRFLAASIQVPGGVSLLLCSWYLVAWSWSLAAWIIFGCLELPSGSLKLIPSPSLLARSFWDRWRVGWENSDCTVTYAGWRCFLVGRSWFLVTCN